MIIKSLLKNIVSTFGYDLVKKDRAGKDPYLDFKTWYAPNKAGTIFDVGANEGQTVERLLPEFPAARIYCFEPFPNAFQTLSNRFAGTGRVTPVPAALGDRAGEQTFHVSGYSPANSLLPNSAAAARYQPVAALQSAGALAVEVATLDDYCRDHSINFIDFLKTDTQGFDLRVLQGGREMIAGNRVAAVCSEVLFASLYENQAYFPEIYQWLSSHGFELHGLYETTRRPEGGLAWADALFLNSRLK